ncbi:MAG TPA: hypothetical protein DDZ40_02370 [Deltaproteobacteria bacterium]|nr:hypothetical protein [Deltaproteobacteria bacterium]
MKFGPDDHSTLDNKELIINKAQKLKDDLVSQYRKLEKMRHGDVHEHVPVSRADGLWPFLLIRSFPGDFGARPIQLPVPKKSPDIILTVNNPNYERTVVGRDQMDDFLRHNTIIPKWGSPHNSTIWVHVWNLGRAPARGVRVRAWCLDRFIGGREFNLGDRTSSTSHLIVKVGSLGPGIILPPIDIYATAECMSDVAGSVRDPRQDRHTAKVTR